MYGIPAFLLPSTAHPKKNMSGVIFRETVGNLSHTCILKFVPTKWLERTCLPRREIFGIVDQILYSALRHPGNCTKETKITSFVTPRKDRATKPTQRIRNLRVQSGGGRNVETKQVVAENNVLKNANACKEDSWNPHKKAKKVRNFLKSSTSLVTVRDVLRSVFSEH